MTNGVNVVIVDDDGRLLLHMRDNAQGISNPLQWTFFGGGLEPDEDPVA